MRERFIVEPQDSKLFIFTAPFRGHFSPAISKLGLGGKKKNPLWSERSIYCGTESILGYNPQKRERGGSGSHFIFAKASCGHTSLWKNTSERVAGESEEATLTRPARGLRYG